MTHGSLFSGVGGFDLAASWLGWNNIFQCEINDFCQNSLKYFFPKTKLYGNIKTTDFTKYRDAVDVISGGFPCQPFSFAGKRQGTADNRFLWKEMLRVISDVQPTWVVAENVYGLVTQQQGVVFDQVQSDLESQGYEVQPFVIPACAVDAPHRRDRVWIVANRSNTGIESMQRSGKNGVPEYRITSYTAIQRSERRGFVSNIKNEKQNIRKIGILSGIKRLGKERITSNANSVGREESIKRGKTSKFAQNIPDFRDFPTQSPVCSRDDGFSTLLDGITFPAWRRQSIEAYGNAIVPQVAYEMFKIINKLEIN